jgi:putrescine transport system permease protein
VSATRRSPLLSVWLLLGYTFLYTPIIILIIFSFNESKLVTVWAGFSTKWYGELLQDRQMLSAAWLSLRLALMSATAAVALGVLAGLVMARFGRFRGHNIFAGMITALDDGNIESVLAKRDPQLRNMMIATLREEKMRTGS